MVAPGEAWGLDGRPARRGLLNPDAISCPDQEEKPFDFDDIDERYVRLALTTNTNRGRGALMRHRASAR